MEHSIIQTNGSESFTLSLLALTTEHLMALRQITWNHAVAVRSGSIAQLANEFKQNKN